MLSDVEMTALEILKHPETYDDIYEMMMFFYGYDFNNCPCVFILNNKDLIHFYEVIRFHIIRSVEN